MMSIDEEERISEQDSIKKEINDVNSNRDNTNELVQLRTKWVDEIHLLQKAIDRENKVNQVKYSRSCTFFFI